MLTRRIGTLGVMVTLAAAGSALLLAQAPQPVATWMAAGVLENPYGDGPSVALEDGRTLIVGGSNADGSPTDVVSIFDPATKEFATAGVLLAPRTGHTATRLKDGRVLVTGGLNGSLLSADVELFDPVAGTSTIVAALPEPRTGHSAARLTDGRVLIAGGRTIDETILRTALVFDPENNSLTPLAGELHVARAFASATTLVDGRVIVIGGTDGTSDLASAEIFNPLSESFSTVATQLTAPVHGHTAVMLPHNGSVLVVGGTSNGAPQSGVDLFLPAEFPDPFSYGDGQFAATVPLSVTRSNVIAGPTSTEGYAFVAGGGSADAEQYRFATIRTDKDDYAPGEHAVITGTGWQPGEQVKLLFQEDPAVHDDYVLTLVADGQGNIYTDEWAPEQHDLNVRFYLTASDSISKAQTTFTDGNLSSTINFTITPGSVVPGATLSWSVTALCADGGGPNTCASEGYTNAGAVQNGYEFDIQQATNAAFTQNLTTRATATTTSGVASGSFAAPASGGPFFYRARHNNQNLPNVPVAGNTTNSWQPSTSGSLTVTLITDTTAPVITPVVTGTLGDNGWYTSNVNVSWTVTDPESAISSSTGCGPTVISSDTAGQVLTCSATSTGGTNSASVTIKRDATAPNVPSVAKSPAANASDWNTTDVSVSFTDTGDNGPSGIASCTSAVTLTAETTGTLVSGTCTDNAGNVSGAASVTVKIDKTGPINVIGTPARPADHNGWYTAPVDITFNGQDALSGVASCTTVHFSGPDGSAIQVFGSCTDAAGNVSANAVYLVNYDTTAPTIGGSRAPVANASGWNNTDVTVSFTCSDATSGLAGSPPAGTVLSAEGANQSASGTCVDNAGNSASATVSDINIDKTAPVVNASRSPLANASGWNNTDVVASYTASDALSGLDSDASGSYTFNADGENQSHTFTIADKAGNSASATISGVNVDKTAPSISGSRTPDANANGWNNTDVTATYTATDATSGLVSPASGNHVFTSEGAGQSITFTVTDLAGNSASFTVSDVNIDNTAPAISASRTPAANANGWNNTDVIGSYTASDILSGLDAVSPSTGSYTFSIEGAGQQHTFTVTDQAGNSATASVLNVNIDKTAPVVAVTGVANGAVYTLGAVPAAGCSTADALSGVSTLAALTVSGGVPPGVGSFTASCNGAVDKAGNTASASVAFTVQFAAASALCNGQPGHQMLQPINFTGSSVFAKKGNSTVPAKFRVCGADGVSLGPTQVVSNFVLYGVMIGTVVDVNEASVDSTNSDTAFRWSASDAQWIFNISTKNLTAGMTYVYRVYLTDGTYIQFQFGVK